MASKPKVCYKLAYEPIKQYSKPTSIIFMGHNTHFIEPFKECQEDIEYIELPESNINIRKCKLCNCQSGTAMIIIHTYHCKYGNSLLKTNYSEEFRETSDDVLFVERPEFGDEIRRCKLCNSMSGSSMIITHTGCKYGK
jgi:hypothetical protein